MDNESDQLTSEQIKSKFDERAGLLKDYINNTLPKELEALNEE